MYRYHATRHSPLCRREKEVAFRHDMDIILHIAALAGEFIENRPPRVTIRRAGEPEKSTEVRFCKSCGFPQVQFEHPRHNKGCIVRQLRGAVKRAFQHMEWHDGWMGHADYVVNREYKYDYPTIVRIRQGFRLLGLR